jgi:hypothetical protein
MRPSLVADGNGIDIELYPQHQYHTDSRVINGLRHWSRI